MSFRNEARVRNLERHACELCIAALRGVEDFSFAPAHNLPLLYRNDIFC